MRVEEKSEKFDLKFNIKKSKIMASSPITKWCIEREKVETVTVFLGLQMTPDSDKGHESKRLLLMGKKAMTKLDRVLKSRDIVASFVDKIHMVKAMDVRVGL